MPEPPDLAMPIGWQAAFTVGLAVVDAAFVAWALHQWRRHHDATGLVVMAASFCCAVFEPLVNVLGLCWYPARDQWQLFELMGRPMPVFVPLGYAFCFGGGTLAMREVIRRWGRASLMRPYIIAILVTTPLELIAVNVGVYDYYGNQPLEVAGYAAWWAPVNLAVPVVAAVAIDALPSAIGQLRLLAVAVVLLLADGAVNGATAWPAWIVLATPDLPDVVVHGAGVACWVLGLTVVWLACSLGSSSVAGASPLDERAVSLRSG